MRVAYIFLLLVIFSSKGIAQFKTIVIIDSKNANYTTAVLEFMEDVNIKEPIILRSEANNGFYRFILPTFKGVAYFVIEIPGVNVRHLGFMLIESGDSICINISSDNKFNFSGKGSNKLQILNGDWQERSVNLASMGGASLETFFDYVNTRENETKEYLEKRRKMVSPYIYAIIEGDLLGYSEYKKMQTLLRSLEITPKSKSKALFEKAISGSFELSPTDTNINSFFFRDYLYQRVQMEQYLEDKSLDAKSIYQAIGKKYHGLIKEKLQALHILMTLQVAGLDAKVEVCIKDFLFHSKHLNYKNLIEKKYHQLENTLVRGANAPNFTLEDVNGKKVSLTDFKNKVVVLDYWFTGCMPCKGIVPAMTTVKRQFYLNADVVFINICIDSEKERWIKNIGKFASASGIQLYTEGKSEEHPAIKCKLPHSSLI